MTTKNHRHRSIPAKRQTRGYCGYSVCPGTYGENPSAHGGVTHYDQCSCGHVRLTNSTGAGREEVGPWRTPD
jgi:hypothetical protein